MKSWNDFKVILPYASEFFGIYQPLLCWKSRIIGNRFDKFRNALYPNLAEQARSSQRAPSQVQLDRVSRAELATDSGRHALPISDLKPVAFVSAVSPAKKTLSVSVSRRYMFAALRQRSNPYRLPRCVAMAA